MKYIRTKGTFDSSFHAIEMIYKEFQSFTSSDKEQEGIEEKSSFFFRRKRANNCSQVILSIHKTNYYILKYALKGIVI